MLNKFFQTVLRSSAVAVFVFAGSAQAALVPLVGDNITYEYDSVTNAGALAIFGTPTIVGDTVRFIPPNFRAESENGAGSDSISANFIFDRVYTNSGADLQQIEVIEFGDYFINTGDEVGVDAMLTAISNVGFGFDSVIQSFSSSADSGAAQTWQIDASYDVQTGLGSGIDDIALSIQNNLFATTDASGELAWVQKKGVFLTASPVPLPAAAWLFGSALLGLVVARRRASAA